MGADMTCKACEERRRQFLDALFAAKLGEATKQAVIGVAEVVGVKKKPKPKATKKPSQTGKPSV